MERKVSVTTGLWRVWGGSDEGAGEPPAGNGGRCADRAGRRCARTFAQIAPPTMRCTSSGGWAPPSASTTTIVNRTFATEWSCIDCPTNRTIGRLDDCSNWRVRQSDDRSRTCKRSFERVGQSGTV
eukprot:scaffold13377_cov61-Phaeocystis_antarctica.AAC.2